MNQNPAERLLGRISLRRLALIIFAAGYFIYALSPQGAPLYSDLKGGAEVTNVALNMLQEGNFAHPFYYSTGPTAHVAPAYVFVYVLVAKLFGIGWNGAMILWAANIGFLALQLALLPVISDRLGLGVLPGAIAAVFGAVVQPYRVLPQWESLFTGALLAVLCVLTLRHFRTPTDTRHSLLLGFLWGIAILTNPECVLLLFAWAHVAAMENAPGLLSRARRSMLVVLAGAALACLPWFIRNYQVFHSVFFVRDNFGVELYTSNNPCAAPTMRENFFSRCHLATHPYGNPYMDVDFVKRGEVGFNQEMMRRAVSWISSNPRAFAWLTARRLVHFWFPYLGSYRYAIPMGVLTVLSFSGLFWMYREHRQAAWLFASTLLLYPLVHYMVQFEARYRYPILWATLLPASFVIGKLLDWPRKSGSDRTHAVTDNDEDHAMMAG